MMAYVPDRGDVVWVLLAPPVGEERVGRRQALVLSPAAYNERAGLAVFCPISSRIEGSPFEVRVPDGMKVSGVILSDQVRSLDWRDMAAELILQLPAATADQVLEKLNILLGR